MSVVIHILSLSQLLGLASAVSTNVSMDVNDDRQLVHDGLAVVNGRVRLVTQMFDRHQAQVRRTSFYGHHLECTTCILGK